MRERSRNRPVFSSRPSLTLPVRIIADLTLPMDQNLDRVQPGRRIVAGAPEGFDAVLLARLAKQADATGLLHIVRDHRRLVRIRRALAFFAPEVETIPLVTWDCSPYDRRSPSSMVSARRVDTLLKLG